MEIPEPMMARSFSSRKRPPTARAGRERVSRNELPCPSIWLSVGREVADGMLLVNAGPGWTHVTGLRRGYPRQEEVYMVGKTRPR
jgi:hypothetical protein